MWQTIWLKWSFGVSKGVLWWLWWLKGLASTCKLGQRRSRNGKLRRAAECKHVLKKQEDNCPYKWQRGWLLGYCHLCGSICSLSSRRGWLPLSKSQRGLLVQPSLLKMSWSWWPSLLTNKQEELPLKPINRHREREAKWERLWGE